MSAVSVLCLTLAQGVAWGQNYDEPPTEPPTAPPPAGAVDIGSVKVPPGSPPYLLSTYRSHLLAPLPAKIWKQGGIPRIIRQDEQFNDPHGRIGNYNAAGTTITANNAFFQSLGTNGRSCVTCHNPPSGMGLSLRNIKARFRANLNDPLFAPVDGANCPDAVPPEYTSGALARGGKGKGKRALRDAYSVLLNKGLIRIPIKVPAGAEFTVDLVSDNPGCNKSETFNKDPLTGEKILSMYRRPIFSASLRFKVPNDQEAGKPTNVMWDGREPSLRTQAISATLGHAQALTPPTPAQIDQIVAFETKFFSAQLVDNVARYLNDGAEGGPRWLAGRSIQPPTEFPPPAPFNEYNTWAGLTGSAKANQKASIARGQAIFNGTAPNSTFSIGNVGGFNDLVGVNPAPFPGSCALCHGFPHAGSELVFPPQRDIGTGGQASSPLQPQFGKGPLPAGDLPIFKLTCSSNPHPFYGSVILTNDPGTAMTTGKCADIGKKTVPALRGLAAREPFFSDGSAKTLRAVVDFYVARFSIPLTEQDKRDLTNFLAAL
jgi:hypothetical protein